MCLQCFLVTRLDDIRSLRLLWIRHPLVWARATSVDNAIRDQLSLQGWLTTETALWKAYVNAGGRGLAFFNTLRSTILSGKTTNGILRNVFNIDIAAALPAHDAFCVYVGALQEDGYEMTTILSVLVALFSVLVKVAFEARDAFFQLETKPTTKQWQARSRPDGNEQDMPNDFLVLKAIHAAYLRAVAEGAVLPLDKENVPIALSPFAPCSGGSFEKTFVLPSPRTPSVSRQRHRTLARLILMLSSLLLYCVAASEMRQLDILVSPAPFPTNDSWMFPEELPLARSRSDGQPILSNDGVDIVAMAESYPSVGQFSSDLFYSPASHSSPDSLYIPSAPFSHESVPLNLDTTFPYYK
ncbi:hypothetical protein FB45DRAFT_889666 [Roridomyces roridus]|uniref:Uncharacterized protein n=1 Tax=Roridomyces roridus TaxID=1738132 RepID=A0AAD7CKY8_9AGAR|nr:hypothetical protein FB45DRAFT_889666 [Roridomyces roridus]